MSLDKTEVIIEKRGDQWCLVTPSGKVYSSFTKEEDARLRFKQIEFFKSRAMSTKEARTFCMFNGKNFNPENFKDYNPEGNKK